MFRPLYLGSHCPSVLSDNVCSLLHPLSSVAQGMYYFSCYLVFCFCFALCLFVFFVFFFSVYGSPFQGGTHPQAYSLLESVSVLIFIVQSSCVKSMIDAQINFLLSCHHRSILIRNSTVSLPLTHVLVTYLCLYTHHWSKLDQVCSTYSLTYTFIYFPTLIMQPNRSLEENAGA